MATLTVTESTDFRGGLAELNITDIVFDTAALATAEFTPTQFGAGLIANNVEITGDDQANIIQVTYAAQGESFSAAGWQFQDWDSETDVVFIVGIAGGDDTITGSSQNDLIAGGGGLDDIDAGGGNDTIWASSIFTAGTILDGGTEFAGGFDQLTLLGLGSDRPPARRYRRLGAAVLLLRRPDGDRRRGSGRRQRVHQDTRRRDELVDGTSTTTSISPV